MLCVEPCAGAEVSAANYTRIFGIRKLKNRKNVFLILFDSFFFNFVFNIISINTHVLDIMCYTLVVNK